MGRRRDRAARAIGSKQTRLAIEDSDGDASSGDDGIFTPSSEQGSFVYPGNYGVFDWGGVAIDPSRQILFANPNYMGFVSRLHRRGTVDATGGTGTEAGLQPMTGTPFAVRSPGISSATTG